MLFVSCFTRSMAAPCDGVPADFSSGTLNKTWSETIVGCNGSTCAKLTYDTGDCSQSCPNRHVCGCVVVSTTVPATICYASSTAVGSYTCGISEAPPVPADCGESYIFDHYEYGTPSGTLAVYIHKKCGNYGTGIPGTASPVSYPCAWDVNLG